MGPLSESHKRLFDAHFLLHSVFLKLVFIVTIAFALKLFVIDTVKINSEHMEPRIVKGDRALISKLHTYDFLKSILRFRYKQSVVFVYPHSNNMVGCLAIVAGPSDTVSCIKGQLTVQGLRSFSIKPSLNQDDILPAEFSPRDNMKKLYVPKRGDSISISDCDSRSIIHLYSMIQQEQQSRSASPYSIKPILLMNNTLASPDLKIEKFALFQGLYKDIPDSVSYNWFFWDRFEAYLKTNYAKESISLTFQILNKNTPIQGYRLKSDFYFLLSANWFEGFDSRYFGPISANHLRGVILGIVWSFESGKPFFQGLRKERFGKVIYF